MTGQGKGFGFVEMSTIEEAQGAITKLNNSRLGGRSIFVNEAKPQERRENNSFDNKGSFNKRGNSRNYNSNRRGR